MRVTNARLRGRDGLCDVDIDGVRITAITPAAGHAPGSTADPARTGPADQPPAEEAASGDSTTASSDTYDAAGRLIAPQFVENHLHLDYANTAGAPRDNLSGTLFEGIQIWAERKEAGLHRAEEIKANALAAARSAASHGVGYIRTHVDITDPTFAAFDALVELKEEIAPWCHLQLVAFPQNGMIAYPQGAALTERALREGADVVGGIPHLEPTREDGVASLHTVFNLAERYDVLVDVHCDEIDDAQSRFVEVMAAQTTARSMEGRVTVSHAVAMGYYDPGYLTRLLPGLVKARLGFVVNPNESLHLQGRGFGAPTPRGIAPARTLTEWGLPVAFGQDSMNDPWYPMGAGDPLRILDSGLHLAHMLTPEYLERCLDFVTTNPARNLGLGDDVRLAEGAEASFIVLDAEDDAAAVRQKSEVLFSMHRGREVFRRRPAQTQWTV